jgi:protein-disulfide isomerase
MPLTVASLATSLAITLLPTAALGASPAPFPDLTMAPLVTPKPIPPIVAPVAQDADIPTDGYALGSADAPVTVEVFEDFQCPYCGLFTQQIEPQLVEAFVRPGIARLVFRDLPFLGEESRWAAVAGRLAAQQGKFWPMHDYLFANQLGENVGSFTPDRLMAMAQAAGLDMDTFIAGLQVPAARALFADILSGAGQAAGSLGINKTPTVVVNGVPVASPDYATVAAAIQAALAVSPPAGSPAASASPTSSGSGAPVAMPSPGASAP